MKNEAVKILFSKITNDTVRTEDKMTICFVIFFSSLLALASYQQVYLSELQSINNNVMVNLAQCGFGDSLSGYLFFCVHVIITNILNKQTKRQECSHCARFSTDTAKVNTWVATSHIHAKVTQKYNEI